jgi:hypothetical protein
MLTMVRCAIAGLLVYASGHPQLEALRPGPVDAALHGFHRDINAIASDVYRTALRFDSARAATSVTDMAVRNMAERFEGEIRKN